VEVKDVLILLGCLAGTIMGIITIIMIELLKEFYEDKTDKVYRKQLHKKWSLYVI